MQRNARYRALVLGMYPSGEMHSSVLLLTPDVGIIRATAYGLRSRYSKLRASVFLFAYGNCTLYTRGEYHTIRDFDVIDGFHGIRMKVHRFYYAALWGEVLSQSHFGLDNHQQVFDLIIAGLQYVEKSTPAEGVYLNIRFFWKYLYFLGECPELPRGSTECTYYDYRSHEFTTENRPYCLPITVGAITYLQQLAEDPKQQASCARRDRNILTAFLQRLIEHIIGKALQTLQVLPDPGILPDPGSRATPGVRFTQ